MFIRSILTRISEYNWKFMIFVYIKAFNLDIFVKIRNGNWNLKPKNIETITRQEGYQMQGHREWTSGVYHTIQTYPPPGYTPQKVWLKQNMEQHTRIKSIKYLKKIMKTNLR